MGSPATFGRSEAGVRSEDSHGVLVYVLQLLFTPRHHSSHFGSASTGCKPQIMQICATGFKRSGLLRTAEEGRERCCQIPLAPGLDSRLPVVLASNMAPVPTNVPGLSAAGSSRSSALHYSSLLKQIRWMISGKVGRRIAVCFLAGARRLLVLTGRLRLASQSLQHVKRGELDVSFQEGLNEEVGLEAHTDRLDRTVLLTEMQASGAPPGFSRVFHLRCPGAWRKRGRSAAHNKYISRAKRLYSERAQEHSQAPLDFARNVGASARTQLDELASESEQKCRHFCTEPRSTRCQKLQHFILLTVSPHVAHWMLSTSSLLL